MIAAGTIRAPDGQRPSGGPYLGMDDYRLAGTNCGMPEPDRKPRVAIADDDVLLRQGLAALLRETAAATVNRKPGIDCSLVHDGLRYEPLFTVESTRGVTGII